MGTATETDLAAALVTLQAQLAEMSARLEQLEGAKSALAAAAKPEVAEPQAPVEPVAEPAQAGITEEEVLAVSAALAAYLGVRVHIRQIRLVSSHAWAQEGRVSIQASHRLHS